MRSLVPSLHSPTFINSAVKAGEWRLGTRLHYALIHSRPVAVLLPEAAAAPEVVVVVVVVAVGGWAAAL